MYRVDVIVRRIIARYLATLLTYTHHYSAVMAYRYMHLKSLYLPASPHFVDAVSRTFCNNHPHGMCGERHPPHPSMLYVSTREHRQSPTRAPESPPR